MTRSGTASVKDSFSNSRDVSLGRSARAWVQAHRRCRCRCRSDACAWAPLPSRPSKGAVGEGLEKIGHMPIDLDRGDFYTVSKHLAPIYWLNTDGRENGKKVEL